MAHLRVRNPRTGEIDYHAESPTNESLDEMCADLRRGQAEWLRGGLQARIAALRAWKQSMESARADIAAALLSDTGRIRESELEIDGVLRSIDRWCSVAPGLLAEIDARPSTIPSVHLSGESVPYSLVGVISPWNFPLLLSTIDTIPALLAGCAVMVKPSEVTPRFIKPLQSTIDSTELLRDVLRFVPGGRETGAAVIDRVDAIAFTGSIPTGEKVAKAAARRFVPAFLELGGKDPAIVLASAGLDRATSALLWGSVANAGQSCQSIERIYVAAPVFEEFVARLARKAGRLRLAHPTPASGEIGPIIDERQARVISAHLQDAVDKGAKVHCGGEVEELDGGLWCRPTVLTGVDHRMLVMTQETFGPVMPVMAFSSVKEAIALANDSEYGLSAAVFAGTEQEALGVAAQINAGGISINDAALTAFVHDAEKNSFNHSGLGGSRMGPAALRRFTRRKAFLIQTSGDPDPWWFSG